MATSNPVTAEDVRCSVCFEFYDSKHLPKRLPCPHSACLPCLGELAKSALPMKCPLCKNGFKIPAAGVQDLPTDILVLKLADNMKCQQCSIIDELNVCRRCKVRVCEKCEIGHRTPTRCELMTNLKEIDEKLKSDSVQNATYNIPFSQTLRKEVKLKFYNIRRALAFKERLLCATINKLCRLPMSEEQNKLQECPVLLTEARSSLDDDKGAEDEIVRFVQETANLIEIMANPKPVEPSIKLTDFETEIREFIIGVRTLIFEPDPATATEGIEASDQSNSSVKDNPLFARKRGRLE